MMIRSCDNSRYNFDLGIIPMEVQNFEEVNTIYDDYNSAGPAPIWTADAFPFVFSTNRNSKGLDFDLTYYNCFISFGGVSGSFQISADPESLPFVDSINSEFNEWGPYLVYDDYDGYINWDYYWYPDTVRIFYTSDMNGNLDIYCQVSINKSDNESLNTVWTIDALNSSSDDGYFCLHDGAVNDREICYFTSNREGTFDIFRAVGEPGVLIETSETLEVTKVDILSGSSDDKCPYIVNDMMVFTSNRDGGFGGYDLWYSIYDGSEWSAPVNFGFSINTEYDEYRPIIIPTEPETFLNDMLIFSSNRPGGIGGYDLYYTGMKKHGDY
ncbi:MAG: hypothetical protein PF450_07395 [Bacteroidales bacterium]|nr:hypothetical protein [Bacteroidales bacterium]